ncbi:hypothetical protein ACFWP3_02720 [Streptomyces sp. NPDC058525]|uniref:hypothetical protein n=1 Tax=Streptomyces sp. NPDC058525 TaxID=3346538 RepID=UPI003663F0B7
MEPVSAGRDGRGPGAPGPRRPAPDGPSPSPGSQTLCQVLVTEYEVLKAEQSARIAARDHLMYATLAVFGATAVAIAGSSRAAELVLLLPPVCIVLGWTYLANDEKVSAIGRYLRTTLRPRLAAAAGVDAGLVLAWESVHRGGPLRVSGKYLQLAVDLIMFALPAVLCVVLHFLSRGVSQPALTVVSAAELAAVAVLSTRIVLAMDAGDRREP